MDSVSPSIMSTHDLRAEALAIFDKFHDYSRSDPFGWDWPTMRAIFPEECERFKQLKWESDQRNSEERLKEIPEGQGFPRGVRYVDVHLARDEPEHPTMLTVATELLFADRGPADQPLVVGVQGHGGWFCHYALIGGKVRVVASANERGEYPADVNPFRRVRYHSKHHYQTPVRRGGPD